MAKNKNKSKSKRAKSSLPNAYIDSKEKEISNLLKHGKPVEQKIDDELFTVDAKPKEITPPMSKKEKARGKLTFAEKQLLPNPNVDAVSKDMKSNWVENPEEVELKRKVTYLVKKRDAGELEEEESSEDDYIDEYHKKAQPLKKRKDANDIWVEDDPINKDDFVAPELKKVDHNRVVTKRMNKISAVEIPSAGMSYRPTYEQHQSVIREELGKEKKAEKMISKVTWGLSTNQGIPTRFLKQAEENAELDRLHDLKVAEQNRKIRTIRDKDGNLLTVGQVLALNTVPKTSKDRKKSLRKNIEVSKKAQENTIQKISDDIDKAAQWMAELDEQEEKTKQKKMEKRIKQKDYEDNVTKKTGNRSLEIFTEPVLLTNELPKTLLNLSNPSYKPLKERFNSLRRRNIITFDKRGRGEQTVVRTKEVVKNSWVNTEPAELPSS